MKMTWTAQSCALFFFLPHIVPCSAASFNYKRWGVASSPAQLNLMVWVTQKIVPSHLSHSHSKVQVKLRRFSLLYIYNHSLLENPGAYQPWWLPNPFKAFRGINMPVPLQLIKQSNCLKVTCLIKSNTGTSHPNLSHWWQTLITKWSA